MSMTGVLKIKFHRQTVQKGSQLSSKLTLIKVSIPTVNNVKMTYNECFQHYVKSAVLINIQIDCNVLYKYKTFSKKYIFLYGLRPFITFWRDVVEGYIILPSTLTAPHCYRCVTCVLSFFLSLFIYFVERSNRTYVINREVTIILSFTEQSSKTWSFTVFCEK